MGGPIAWLTATRVPSVVRSLALVFTSPVGHIQAPRIACRPCTKRGHTCWPTPLISQTAWMMTRVDQRVYAARSRPGDTTAHTEEESTGSRLESKITYLREASETMATKRNHSEATGLGWPREAFRSVKCATVVIHAAKEQFFALQHAEVLKMRRKRRRW
ncbi:hypothetical protein VUR80DRAFT_3869 [Thermomyces stellatus]